MNTAENKAPRKLARDRRAVEAPWSLDLVSEDQLRRDYDRAKRNTTRTVMNEADYEFWTTVRETILRELDARVPDDDENQEQEPEPQPEPKTPGRPAVGPRIELRLDEDALAEVDAAAALLGLTRAEWCRAVLTAQAHRTVAPVPVPSRL